MIDEMGLIMKSISQAHREFVMLSHDIYSGMSGVGTWLVFVIFPIIILPELNKSMWQ